MTDRTKPEWLTAAEVSEQIRFSVGRVYRLARAGRIPGAVKIGGRYRFSRKKLEAWLEDGAPLPRTRRLTRRA